jgi:hypothetical protein
MGGEIRHQTDSIRDHSKRYETQVGDLLKRTRQTLNGAPREAASAAFTMYGFELAMAHTLATEWADADLQTKVEQLYDFGNRFRAVAQNHDQAEQASTLDI